jgi:DNA processing protein
LHDYPECCVYFRRVKEDELIRCIAISMQPLLGPVSIRNLVSYCGSVEEVFRQKGRLLKKIPGIGATVANSLAKHDMFSRAEEELAFTRKHDISVLFYTNDAFPQRLHHCSDAPVLLYYKGNHDLNSSRMVAIVGTRSATAYGKEFTEKFIADLKEYKITVISGLAYGIDIRAHRAAMMQEVPTIGVIAHGLDRIYPSEHKNFAQRMMEHGGILTEYPSGTNPDRENFPSRNRIVAGICDAVVVIEAAAKGGALITADIANSYNRDVFAVPGRIDDRFSEGCNRFIRQNRAALITSAGELAEAMSWELETRQELKAASVQHSLFIELDPQEEKIRTALTEGKTDADSISWKAGLPASQVNSLLLQLELKGVIRALPGRVYQLV